MKTDDMELLKLAAKAAGIELDWDVPPQSPPWSITGVGDDRGPGSQWNPLADDGDALRLAVRLGLTVCNEQESAGVAYCTRGDTESFPVIASGDVGDPPGVTQNDYAATRRAIVRAAAEIGRAA